VAGTGFKKLRIANLPPEVPDEKLRTTVAPFGQVLDIQNEMWVRTHRYAVANGIRQVTMMLTQHVPSHLVIAGQKCLYLMKVNPPPVTDAMTPDTNISCAPVGKDG